MDANTEERTDLLTAGEAAKILRVHPYTIYDLLRTKRLVGFKINRRWRIYKKSLEQLMEAFQEKT